MSELIVKSNIAIVHPKREHFAAIQALCKKVYPFSKPWSEKQLDSHRSYFPGGQFIAIDKTDGSVVGLAFSLIIDWDDYSPQDNWVDLTSTGYFHNHNPRKGKTLYGAEVMVAPDRRGQGIGKLLYEKRRELASKYSLKRIRAGARLRGYSKYKDSLSPSEYVKKVIEETIFDPTLSFQLKQGFKVIDVAKNYLVNDPESLGYAAVIEWLNPQFVSPIDIKKQSESVQAFIEGEKYFFEHLPKELHRLVRKATASLGQVILDSEGPILFEKIEKYRTQLKKLRGKISRAKLSQLFELIQKESPSNQYKIAHAFALQLEIVNVCEMAYRTWRLKIKPIPVSLKKSVDLKYILTAHPTEARSQATISLLQELSEVILTAIDNNFVFNESHLLSQIRLLWMTPLSKPVAPSVLDEAEYICSLVFSNSLFDFIVAEKPNFNIRLRTWVGGDKDGHPGVNDKVMLSCLSLSRSHLVRLLKSKLAEVLEDLKKLERVGVKVTFYSSHIKSLNKDLNDLLSLSAGDGGRVKKWKMKFQKMLTKAPPYLSKHHQIILCQRILDGFPALVLSIELREDAGEIANSLKDTKSAIRKMLLALSELAGPLDITSYARGLVVSHCESELDIENAVKLVQKSIRNSNLPVVPLFESRQALLNSRKILKLWLEKPGNLELVKRHWSEHFEVMLGYSDSAKEIGVLPSRNLIQKAMFRVEKVLKRNGIKSVFFHGSGGSVARGGGSIAEQVQWWADSAIERPKMTIQGEMIQRLFSTTEILRSHCAHISSEALKRRLNKAKYNPSETLNRFSQDVEKSYRSLVGDEQKLMAILEASPYRYLELLQIGSRPAKRRVGKFDISQLRAIPWVLCWTQTRALLPSWWGVGSAWKKLNGAEKQELRSEFGINPMFSSFVKSLGFTLAKVELEIWRLYFDEDSRQKYFHEFECEFKEACEFVRSLSGEKDLIWHRPWLSESIRLRSPHIHILNLLQLSAMSRKDETLLKESLVGIACGMLTTG